ncbi:MAG: hypothetical protein KAW51_01970 [Candidatus Lokiarchaeota archaeon]|nr:hypothetical protein [Candidatus Lokiarchaeota archaeon]
MSISSAKSIQGRTLEFCKTIENWQIAQNTTLALKKYWEKIMYYFLMKKVID